MIIPFVIAFILYKITGSKIWLVIFLILAGISIFVLLIQILTEPRIQEYPDAIPGIPAPTIQGQTY